VDELNVTILLAGVVAGAAPVLLATLGETITEKAGVINLALDGSILLSAMTAFAVALETQSLALGYLAAAGVGALVAMLVAVFSIFLGQNQVAVGFVLTLMTRDLAYFLGNPYARVQGLALLPQPVPLLSELPIVGPIFFNHNFPVYGSLLLIGLCGWYFSRTPLGLELRSVGEHPRAAYARGIDPRRTACLYAIVGGMLVGVAGATFALATKPGWGRPQGAEGAGWIALALVIFGGWNPLKAALGAYLFSLLQVLGIYFQGWFPSVPAQVFQVAPFPLMIFTLVIMSAAQKESALRWAAGAPWVSAVLGLFTGRAPAALGKPFRPE
jgi:simple sugar transport system permease protein